jgi:hypothetical protein
MEIVFGAFGFTRMVRACKLLAITTTSNDWSPPGNDSTPL